MDEREKKSLPADWQPFEGSKKKFVSILDPGSSFGVYRVTLKKPCAHEQPVPTLP